ncbi:MAG: IS110 family transposase [Planctomycetes bacterium]|nr:IS110 family transposase [Planctomycetota bacterium]
MIILAIDLGKFNSMCCFFDTRTQKHEFLNAATTRRYLTSVLTHHQVDLVVMEACGPSGWVNDLCQEHRIKTLVCSTNEEAWRWKNVKRKTDKDDALKLARLAMMRQLKPVHVPTHQGREHRTLVKYRKTLDQRINRIKNSIRSLFANRGIEIARGRPAWGAGRELIDSYRKLLADCSMEELWQGQLDVELTQLDSLREQLAEVERRLEAIAEEDERIQRVRTIPGVGRKTAEVLVTALDDVHRFDNARQVSAYIGLVPRQYQSGETDRNGRITKRGSRLLRAMLLECAWVSLQYNPWARATYDRICGGQKTRKKKAAIALARKIAVVAWSMLKHETDWDPRRMGIVVEEEGEAEHTAAGSRQMTDAATIT